MPSPIQLTPSEEAQLTQTIEMFEVITQSQPHDYQSLEILREAYFKLGRENDLIETSKRIAKAYVQMGQLSSAILEYESILQRYPDDEETRAALADIESRATSLSSEADGGDGRTTMIHRSLGGGRRVAPSSVDDGREALRKVFVDGKHLNMAQFEESWVPQDWSTPPEEPVLPFVQILADRDHLPIEKSMRLISDKTRLAYFPVLSYDLDIELARSYPAETCMRWCVLPFDRMSKSILVATANPFNQQATAELEAVSQGRLLWYLAPPSDICAVLKKVFRRF